MSSFCNLLNKRLERDRKEKMTPNQNTITPAQMRIIQVLGDSTEGLTVKEIRKALKLNTAPNSLVVKLRNIGVVQVKGTKIVDCNFPGLSWTKAINAYGLTQKGQAIYESMTNTVKKQKGIYVAVSTD